MMLIVLNTKYNFEKSCDQWSVENKSISVAWIAQNAFPNWETAFL